MDIDPEEWQRHRRYLLAVAYRLLGTVTEAEDAVQEAYARLAREDRAGVPDVRVWLVVAVARVCVDELRSARARRESYVGPWLPEPLVGDAPGLDPGDGRVGADSVEMARMVVLETLTPAERAAFVLHDTFGVDYPRIAEIVGRREPACRQLVARAQRRAQEQAPPFDGKVDELREIACDFMAAASERDHAALVDLLDPGAVLRLDSGGAVRTARRPVRGADEIGRVLMGLSEQYGSVRVRLVPVNGRPGFVLYHPSGWLLGVCAVAVKGRRVSQIDLVLNPDKLRLVSARSLDGPEWTMRGIDHNVG